VSGGTARIAFPRKAESLSSLDNSAVKLVPASGTFTSLPDCGVKVTPVIVTEKASMDVAGGGVRGFAASESATLAVGLGHAVPKQLFG
jgi:hypothetical protein